MFKKIIILLLIFSMVSLIGCANEDTQVQTNETQAPEQRTVRIVYKESGGPEAITQWMNAAKAEFEEIYPNVTVELIAQRATDADYNTKISLILKSDSTVDVVFVDSFLVPALVGSRYLAPIPVNEWPEYDEQFAGNIKEGMKIDGNTYAISVSTDTRGLFYNKTVFENAGITVPFEPKNWEDIIDTVQKLHDAGVAYPIWMNGSRAQGEGTTMQTFQMLLSGTNDWIVEEEKWVARAPGITDSLKFIQELFEMGIYTTTELATMLDARSWLVVNEKMPQGVEIGILLDGNWKGNDFIGFEDSIGVTPMPKQAGGGFTSMSGGWTLAIPSLSENKDLAFDFIQVAANKNNMLTLSNVSGDMNPRRDVSADPAYIEGGFFRAAMTPFAEFTKFRPGKELYPAVSTEIQAAVESVITGRMTAIQAAEEYAKRIKNLVGDGNWIEK